MNIYSYLSQILLPGNERTHTIHFLSLFTKGEPGFKPVFPECVFIVNKRQVGTSGKSIGLGMELAVY